MTMRVTKQHRSLSFRKLTRAFTIIASLRLPPAVGGRLSVNIPLDASCMTTPSDHCDRGRPALAVVSCISVKRTTVGGT